MPSGAWREPASLLELRWGHYRWRYLVALVLILAGALLVQAASVYASYFILVGIGAHILGWWVLPGRGARRVIIALPSAICAAGPLIGSMGSILAVACLAGWLWARERPPIAWLVLIFPVISGIVLAQLYPQYGDGGIVVAVTLLVVAGSAWLARVIAATRQHTRSQ